uniref:Transposase IS66 family protein n=1 Tax=Candidatus Kentrum eta TaxID=2126337 RepID=A0A450V882_9GAMM|nr:MAG: Transposase IS66 family protein [Candidatus Kentron sp. H]VFK01023.1 MAG: Transposase IS66 family protein [Candidatus Kentron sp. H]VFK04819.1 MAG: Transposase IS66 family protein [Candidatus Kentron sp. H]
MPHPMIMAEDEICKHYRIILEQADQEEAAPIKGKRGRPKQSPGRNLLNRLREHQDGILAFALRIEVPFTNNQAERDPRLSKGKLKVSGCLCTVRGARISIRIQAIISTFRKRRQNVFAGPRKVFTSPVV